MALDKDLTGAVDEREKEPDPADDPAHRLPRGYEEAMGIMAFAREHDMADVPMGKVFSLGPCVSAVAAAAEAGDVEAMAAAARYWLANSQDPAELAKAKAWLQQAARQGGEQAQ